MVAADGHRVLTLGICGRTAWLFLAVGLVVSACSTAEFAREDAIGALQTTGVNEAEATCMADSLLALDLLDAADPRRSRTEVEQAGLVSAAARCVQANATPIAVVAGTQVSRSDVPRSEVVRTLDADVVERSVSGGLDLQSADVGDTAQVREAAIQSLISLGRSAENASCVVDWLLDVHADDLFENPNFGMGLDTFEAQAFAACI